MEQLGTHWTDFREIWYEYLSKICRETSSFIKIGQERRFFTWKTCTRFLIISRSILVRMMNVSDKRRGNRNTRFTSIFNDFFFLKWRLLWDDVEKYYRTRQAAFNKMARAHCMLDTLGYIHALRICNTHCIFTATMVARTRLNVTLHLHCLSFRYLQFTASWMFPKV
jgi:hypothetical protein